MLQKSVKVIMEAKVLSLPPKETLSKALSLMSDNNISFIVIASKENKPLGVITERDILKNVWNKQGDGLQVTDVMSSPVLTISADEDVMSAIHTLVLRNIRHLVVVDKDKRICGVLTLTDFLQKLGFEYFVDFKDVGEIMDSSPLTLPTDAEAFDALSSLSRTDASCLIAMEGNRPAGIFTERDALRITRDGQDLSGVSLREIMKSPVIHVQESSCVFEALSVMNKNKIRHLPVINSDGELSGLTSQIDVAKGMELSYTAFMKKIIEAQERKIREANERLEEKVAERTSELTEANERLQREIEERKRTEAERLVLAEQLQTLLDQCPDYLYFKDANRRFVRASKAFCDLFNCRLEDIIGKRDEDLFPPEISMDTIADDRSVIETGKPIVNKEEGGGELPWVLTTKAPWYDNEGKIAGLFGITRDITEHKRAMEALKESDNRYKRAEIAGNIGSWDWNILSGELHWSERIYTIFGLSRQEFGATYDAFLDSVHPDDRQFVVDSVKAAIEEDKDYAIEHRVVWPDKTVRWVSETGAVFRNEKGEAVQMLGIVKDITENKQAEESLRLLEKALETTNMGITIAGTDGSIIYTNPADADMHGYSLEELTGKNIDIFAPAELRNALTPKQIEAAKTKKRESVNIRKDGSTFPAYLISDIVKSASGDPIGLVTTCEDITERKLAEEALRESEEKFRGIFNNAQVALFQTRISDGKLLECNERLAQIFGYKDRNDCISHFLTTEHYLDAGTREKMLSEIKKKGEISNFEAQLSRKDGAAIWVRYSAKLYQERGYLEGVATDITEHKQAEEALHKSEEQFRSVVEKSPIPMIITDKESNIEHLNDKFIDVFGWTTDDVRTPDEWWNAVYPDKTYRQEVQRSWEKAVEEANISGREIEAQEWNIICKNGAMRTVEFKMEPVSENRSVITMIDITERKEAQARIKKQIIIMDAMVNGPAEIIIFALDRDYNYITFNIIHKEEMLKIYNVNIEVGMNMLDLINTPEIRNLARASMDRALKGESFLEVNTQPGLNIVYEFTWSPIIERNDQVIGVSCFIRDVTERKQAEKELRESEERFRAVFDNALDGILLAEKETRRFLTGNREICHMLGYTLEEIEQLNVVDIYPAESLPQVKEQFYKQTRGEIEVAKDIPVKRKDGGIFYADIKSSSVTLTGKIYEVGLFRDITERKQAEEELHKAYDEMEKKVKERTKDLAGANSKLKELDKLKSMFIASMSHELRTPLNAIIGFTGVILQGMVGDINDKQEDQLGRVYRNARHLLALITDVIDISKIEAGKISPFAEDFVLKEVIDESVDDLMDDIERKGLAIEVNVPLKLKMKSDRRRMLECTLNLLSNAVKYTEEGKITIDVKKSGKEIEISVSDTGIGIAGGDMDKLFIPFERLNSHLRIQTPGTGLGLYLCKSLSREVLGGDVSVRSEPGEGSTFTLRVPKEIQTAKTIQSIKEGGKEQ